MKPELRKLGMQHSNTFTSRILQLGVLRACTSAFISTSAAARLSEVYRIRLHKLCDKVCPSLSTISFGSNFPKDQHLPNQTINKLYPIAHSRFTASERMILIHRFLTDLDHVSAVVKSLRSSDNPPSNRATFLHFQIPQRVLQL